MKIVIISDTHGDHARLGRLSGDVLIHCGDFAVGHDNQEAALRDLDLWFAEQSFERVICVGGNHDFLVEERMAKGLDVFRHAECLQDQTLEIGGLKFHGAPWVPELTQWAHFRTAEELQRAWARVPEDVDVLITHTPPRGICDSNSRGKSCGCEWLHQRVMTVRPQVHCFGHIHASAGVQRHADTVFVNGSVVNSRYEVCRGPVVLDIEPRRTRGDS